MTPPAPLVDQIIFNARPWPSGGGRCRVYGGTVPTLDEQWSVWDGWIHKVYNQVVMVHHRRQIRDELLEMVKPFGADAGLFWEVYDGQYVDSQVMAVRRQADTGSDTESLRRLLGQLVAHHHLVTREWYATKMVRPEHVGDSFYEQIVDGIFDEFASPKVRTKLDRGRIMRDQAHLDTVSAELVAFATARVAHSLPTPPPIVTWDQFNTAVDELGALAKRYYLLITGSSVMSVVPYIQGDWKAPFRRPLAPSFDKPGQGRA